MVEEFEGQLDSNPRRVKFKAKIGGGSNFEELIEYNDLELIEEQKEFDSSTWRFRKILDHRAPRTVNAESTLQITDGCHDHSVMIRV